MSQPKFVPQEGQIDFTHARWAPVVNCVLVFEEKILLVKRSAEMDLYPNTWNGISGFLDDQCSLEEKALLEIQEETGLTSDDVQSITPGQIFDLDSPEYHKTWVVHPVLVKVKKDDIQLDWEASEYRWFSKEELRTVDLIPGFKKVLQSFGLL